MPSRNMLPKGKRRQTVKPAYRAHRDTLREADEAARQKAEAEFAATPGGGVAETADSLPDDDAEPALPGVEHLHMAIAGGIRSFVAEPKAQGKRLDAYLAKALPEISRGRVQLLIDHGQVRVDGAVEKASLRLAGGETIEIDGEPQPEPLKAEPEDIPLHVVYEDDDLAVIDKPAGMTVHAGAGDAEHNRGTLVNALLFHFGRQLSAAGGALRPGIVHRLDKETSGLIVVAKHDTAHRRLAEMFSGRTMRKVYLALVHGAVTKDEGTADLPIGRDAVRRTRMTAKRSIEAGARPAVTHWRVLERIGSKEGPGPLGVFTLLEVHIETGRTHQIRVHMAALGHPVVGDTLYGAPRRLRRTVSGQTTSQSRQEAETEPAPERNFLHAAELTFTHPRTGEVLALRAPLPPELERVLTAVRVPDPGSAGAARDRQLSKIKLT